MNNTVCKFFLQGTCRFGTNCKFSHQVNTSSGHQNYASAPVQGATGQVDIKTLIKSVVNDMIVLEKGGQWLLSCYAPFKEKPVFPGFSDTSMEEVRLGFYEAATNGNLDAYKTSFQNKLQEVAVKAKALQNPSAAAVELIKSIYYSSHSGEIKGFGSTNAFQTNSTFPSPLNSSNSIFGNVQQNSMATSTLFNSSQNQNTAFFNVPTTQQPVVSSSSIFGGVKTGQNIFGNFQQNTNPLFNPSNFNTGPIFNNTQVNPSGSLLAPQNVITNSSNAFQPPANVNVFNTYPTTNGAPVQQIIPQPLNNTQASVKQSDSVFQKPETAIQLQRNFGNLYSNLQELSKEDIEWFESSEPDLRRIPELPPTYDMCFKNS